MPKNWLKPKTAEQIRDMRRPYADALGKARREYLVRQDSYSVAIDVADRKGDFRRLVRLLRTRKPLLDHEFAMLADLIERKAKLPRGRRSDEDVHRVATVAEALTDLVRDSKGRATASALDAAIEWACRWDKEQSGRATSQEKVRDLLNRPKKRRLK